MIIINREYIHLLENKIKYVISVFRILFINNKGLTLLYASGLYG